MSSSDSPPPTSTSHLAAALLLAIGILAAIWGLLDRPRLAPALLDNFSTTSILVTAAIAAIVPLVWHLRRTSKATTARDAVLMVTANLGIALSIFENALRGAPSQLFARGIASMMIPLAISLAASAAVAAFERWRRSRFQAMPGERSLGYAQLIVALVLLLMIIRLELIAPKNPPPQSAATAASQEPAP